MAGAFWPNRLDAIHDRSWLRLAATARGCTVAVTAASNAATDAMACCAACSAWAAAALSQPRWDAATPIIARAAGPCHAALTNPDVTDENEAVAELSSRASSFQPDAAANSGSEPAPANISPEFSSGGNTKKFMGIYPGQLRWWAPWRIA